MRKINTRTFSQDYPLKKDDAGTPPHFLDELRLAAQRPRDRRAGLDLAEIEMSLKITAAIDRAEPDGPLILEDAEWALLKAKIDATGWQFAHADLVDLINAVHDAESVEYPDAEVGEGPKGAAA